MTNYPKVSVVTITYGHENYITQTIDGVLMQDYLGEIELIIANDHSPDSTDKVIKEYLAVQNIPTNFNIKYTRHEKNKGMMPNFMWALEQASGKYIALCEGDDYWTNPQKLQKQVGFLEGNTKYSMVFSNAKVIVECDEITNNSRGLKVLEESREYTSLNIVTNWLIPTASVVFRTIALTAKHINNLRNKNFMVGDVVLFLSLAENGKLYGMKDYFVLYRRHSAGATNFQLTIDTDKKAGKHYLEIIKVFGEKFKKPLSTHIGRVFLSQALYALKNKDVSGFLRAGFYVLTYKPNIIINYLQKKYK